MSKIKDTLTSLDYKYLDKSLQDQISPDDALAALVAGNERFVSGNTKEKAYGVQITGTKKGQFPHSVVLSCIDSRVPTEIVFDQGIGDIFNARLAGNVCSVDVLGSIEYACKVAGSKLVVVLGHTSCGAVKGAIANVRLGNITELISKIKPAIYNVTPNYSGDKTVENADFVDKVVLENVLNTINVIKNQSVVLAEMMTNNEIDIVGAIYDVATGKVAFL